MVDGWPKKPIRFTKPWKMTQINAVRSEQNLETLQLNESLVFPLTIGHRLKLIYNFLF